MKKIANILYIWLIQVHLALSECYDTTYTRCDEFNQFDGYIMSYDAGKLPIWYDNSKDKIIIKIAQIYFSKLFFENILIDKLLQLMARVVKQQFVKVMMTVKHLSMIVQ